MKTKFLFGIMAIAMVLFSLPMEALTVIKETSENTGLDANALVSALNAVVVFLAIQLSKLIKKAAPGWILGALIPILSAGGAWVIGMVSEDTSWILTFIFGFLSTFIHQLISQLTSSSK